MSATLPIGFPAMPDGVDDDQAVLVVHHVEDSPCHDANPIAFVGTAKLLALGMWAGVALQAQNGFSDSPVGVGL